jgi:hypothetical protein
VYHTSIDRCSAERKAYVGASRARRYVREVSLRSSMLHLKGTDAKIGAYQEFRDASLESKRVSEVLKPLRVRHLCQARAEVRLLITAASPSR